MRVLGNRVLVALPPEPEELKTDSGIVLVRDPDRLVTPTRGIVVALGEKSGTVDIDDVMALVDEYELSSGLAAALKQLGPAPFDVHVGDCVVFPAHAGEEFDEAGVSYVVLAESEIIGVVEPLTSEAAA